jgi:ADP-ribose pyrophosphatase YjhB (NUDIX family)
MRTKVYTESDWLAPSRSVELPSAEVYAAAIAALVFVCCDTVIVRRGSQGGQMLLTKRTQYPAKGEWWCFGGRMLPSDFIAGDRAFAAAAQRRLKHETGLDIELSRFSHIQADARVWGMREQEPQELGCAQVVEVFMVSLSEKEIAEFESELNLDPTAMDIEVGHIWADRSKLQEIGAHQIMVDLYDQIFPDNEGGA